MLYLLMLSNLIKVLTLFTFSANVFSQSVYTVKLGDILSKIVETHTSPTPALYGKNGRIHRVVLLNPNIKNPHEIYAGDQIILQKKITTPSKRKKPEVSAQKPNLNKKNNAEGSQFQDWWSIGALYGLKYFDYQQNGVLGNADLTLTMAGTISTHTQYRRGDYKFRFTYQTYHFEYTTPSSTGNKRLNSFDLLGSYKEIKIGASFYDTPILKNDNGNILLSKISLLTFKLGYEKKWFLPLKKLTAVSLGSTFSYLITGKSNNLNIKITEATGTKMALKFNLSRSILARPHYKIFLNWPIDLTYQSLSTKISWGTTRGNIKSNPLSISSTLGAEVHF